MDRAPAISVIVPALNVEAYIGQAVRSVLEQTFQDFEIIIVDDGSTDGTRDVIRQFKDSRIKLLIHERNRGVCEARNTGIKVARGIWIAPLDGDDAWRKDRLESLINVAEDHPRAFIGSDVLFCLSGKNDELKPWKTLFEDRRLNPGPIFYPSASDLIRFGLDVKPIFPRELIMEKSLAFDQKYWGHDWMIFLLKLMNDGLKFIIINDASYLYRLRFRSDSTSYATILNQVGALDYLQNLSWLDAATRRLLCDQAKTTRYRLLTTSILEKRWGRAAWSAVRYPKSLVYLLRRIKPWLIRKKISSITSDKEGRAL
jgi:glycosyltransferase involved in cell wall biosynthesis